jgi:hypothetical protein
MPTGTTATANTAKVGNITAARRIGALFALARKLVINLPQWQRKAAI